MKHIFTILSFIIVSKALFSQQFCETTIIIPAQYDTISEEIKTGDAWIEYICVPAVYKNVNKQRIIRPKYIEKQWKWVNGKKVICEVEIPAKVENYVVKQLVTPSATQIIQHPATYKNVITVRQIKPSEVKTVMVDCNEITNLINSQ